MKGIELLNKVLPEHGLMCIMGLTRDKSKPAVTRFFDYYNEDAAELVDMLDSTGRDVYFAAATFCDPKDGRGVHNVHSVKSFFYDLDCNKGVASYESKKAAATDLFRFLDETRIPRPTLVDSGHGIHAYWALDKAIDYNTWKPIADSFKQLAREHNLRIDPSVTADGARVLRLPGTSNKRYEKHVPATVKFLAPELTLEQFISYIGYTPKGAYSVASPDPVMDKLLKESRKFKFSRIYKKSISTVEVTEEVEEEDTLPDGTKVIRLAKKKVERNAGCPQIAHCVANRETLEEPMWTAALSTAWFCIDRIDAIAMVSKGYKNTTPEEWYEKASKREGPYNCDTWKGLDHGYLCTQCIHRGKIKNPITLGTVIEQALPEDNVIEAKHATLGEVVTIELPNDYPEPWLRPKSGGVALRGKLNTKGEAVADDEDPDEVLVYEHDLWVKRRMWDGKKEIVLMARSLPHDGVLEFSALLSDIFKTEKLQAILADKGITAAHNSRRLALLKSYLSAWVDKLQKATAADKMRSQFGWQDNDTVFVIGSREIDSNGDLSYSPIKSSIEKIADIYTKKGTLDAWKHMANHYARPGNEARAFGLFCSFGSPLYKFIGEGSTLVHLTNAASGVGKSSVQKAGLSVWGDPMRSLMTDSDTHNAKINRAGVVNNMLCGIDELTNIKPEVMSPLTFDLSAGRGKNRLRGGENEERENNATWSTLFLTSGNNSAHDTLKQHKSQVEGEMYRVLDVFVPLDVTLTKAEADAAFTQVFPKNYGIAGEEFMRYVVPNKDSVIARLKELHKHFDLLIGANSKERFYSATFAAAFTGAEIANKLGLIDIPLEPVMEWAKKLITETRTVIAKSTPVTDTGRYEIVVNEYWNQIIAQVLVVNAGDTQTDQNLLNQQSLKPVIGSLKGRYEVKTKTLYLAAGDFDLWLRERRMPSSQIVAALKERGTLDKEGLFTLGYDTNLYNTAPVLTYRFNTTKLTPPA